MTKSIELIAAQSVNFSVPQLIENAENVSIPELRMPEFKMPELNASTAIILSAATLGGFAAKELIQASPVTANETRAALSCANPETAGVNPHVTGDITSYQIPTGNTVKGKGWELIAGSEGAMLNGRIVNPGVTILSEGPFETRSLTREDGNKISYPIDVTVDSLHANNAVYKVGTTSTGPNVHRVRQQPDQVLDLNCVTTPNEVVENPGIPITATPPAPEVKIEVPTVTESAPVCPIEPVNIETYVKFLGNKKSINVNGVRGVQVKFTNEGVTPLDGKNFKKGTSTIGRINFGKFAIVSSPKSTSLKDSLLEVDLPTLEAGESKTVRFSVQATNGIKKASVNSYAYGQSKVRFDNNGIIQACSTDTDRDAATLEVNKKLTPPDTSVAG